MAAGSDDSRSLSLEEASRVAVVVGGDGGKDLLLSSGAFEAEEWWTPERLGWFYAMLVSLMPVLVGYDAGIMSGSISDIADDLSLTSGQEAAAMAVLNVVAGLGALGAGAVGDGLGRKGAIALAAVLTIIGSSITTFATTFAGFMWGRTFVGLGCGCGVMLTPVYLAELVPAHVRGSLVALTDLWLNLGLVLGFSLSWVLCVHSTDGSSVGWRVSMGVGMLLPLLLLGALLVLPESPRWLLSHGFQAAARDVVDMMSHSAAEAGETLAGMHKALAHEAGHGSYGDALCPQDAYGRGVVLLVVCVSVAQQLNGSENALYYTPSLLQAAGLSSEQGQLGATVGVGGCKALGDVAAALVLDQWGRRPTMIASASGVSVCVLLLGLCGVGGAPWWVVLLCLCLLMACFSLGLGAVTFLLVNELLPMRVRSKVGGVGVCLNRLVAGATLVACRGAVSSATTMGALWLGLFLPGSLLSLLLYVYYLPETANQSLEDIDSRRRADSNDTSPGNKAYQTIE